MNIHLHTQTDLSTEDRRPLSAHALAKTATRDTLLEELAVDMRRIEEILARMDSYKQSCMEYSAALKELETRLHIINDELSLSTDDNPIEDISTRIKTTKSIVNKMKRKDIPISVKNMEANLFDIAGIRVICSFVDDVYNLANSLREQKDLIILQVKDYIQEPKPNGYRSYHMIIEVPFYLSSRKVSKKVELQFRTIAMDFWASLEHKMRYKKDFPDSTEVHRRLKTCAEMSAGLDREMQEIHRLIQNIGRQD